MFQDDDIKSQLQVAVAVLNATADVAAAVNGLGELKPSSLVAKVATASRHLNSRFKCPLLAC